MGGFCGCPACWVAYLLRAGRGLFPGTAGVAGVRGYLWARVRWVLGSSGVGVFCARLWVYPVCYEVDSSPLFNFNRIFPPFPGACRNLAQKPLI